ncbi:MAG: nucleotide exchange factor GrpE [Gammaproteobacteria bacterium]|nr:nucleotide exchange factor GrpE [Gammaproteobacteria bacterium]
MSEKHPLDDTHQNEAPASSEPQSKNDGDSASEAITKKFEELRQQLEMAKTKADENFEKALRSAAELENYRRQADREIEKAHKFALEKFAKGLLPVLDSMEQALEVKSTTDDSLAMREGMELTLKLFLDTLTRFGLEQLNPVGQAFNAEFHEAISMVPAPESAPNTVIQVFQKGYLLNGRLVRPARVIVAAKA